MTYKEAKELHRQDKLMHKGTGELFRVLKTEIYEKDVYVLCNDGEYYHHTDLEAVLKRHNKYYYDEYYTKVNSYGEYYHTILET